MCCTFRGALSEFAIHFTMEMNRILKKKKCSSGADWKHKGSVWFYQGNGTFDYKNAAERQLCFKENVIIEFQKN